MEVQGFLGDYVLIAWLLLIAWVVLAAVIATLAWGLAGRLAILLRGEAESRVRLEALRQDVDRVERALREEQRLGRGEVKETLAAFETRLAQFTERTEHGIEALRGALTEDSRKSREEAATTLSRFSIDLQGRFDTLAGSMQAALGEVRMTLESRLNEIQQRNAAQLEQMRQTVDERLQATLEARLGASFKLVSERLEQVHRGLGEMQGLASGVGDLKRVLGNVKTRGIFGELQLAAVLEQVLTPDQYAANVAVQPNSNERVEYAIRLPGASGELNKPVWLPIDAKFPREDYERLLDAQECGDADAAAAAAAALERRVREQARTIASKYVAPPHTTDFAILFLPTEGLYAEVLRRPGLVEALQREHRVVISGPTTLAATLNSLRMGFRTLAIEQRSSEVWQILGAVRTEFGRFGGVLDKVRKQIGNVGNTLDEAGIRSRAIERKLRGVESATPEDAEQLLGDLPMLKESVEGADALGAIQTEVE